MAAIFHEPRKPGLHALIIGAEDKSASGLFSCANSAASVADWLQTLETGGTKLSSIDLLIHSESDPSPFYRRGRGSYPLNPPTAGSIAQAVRGWRERLQGDDQNVAFFYFSGPTIYHRDRTCLVATEPLHPEPLSNLIDLDNLWRGMADLPLRQLFFIESCPTRRSEVELGGSPLLPAVAPDAKRGARARYLCRLPATTRPGLDMLALSGGLRAALDGDGLISTSELGRRLGRLFDRGMREMGLNSFDPLEAVYEDIFPLPSLFGNLNRAVSADGSPDRAGEAGGEGGEAAVPGEEEAAGAAEEQVQGAPAITPRPGPETADVIARIAGLSDRQRLCLHLLREGRTIPRIARSLDISVGMVESALHSASLALGVESYEAAAALLTGLPATARPIEPEPEVPPEERIARLSPRHRRLLRLVQQGASSIEMAAELHLSPNTINTYLSEAIRRLEVGDRHEASQMLAAFEGQAGPLAPGAAGRTPAAAKAVAVDARRAPEANTHFVSDDPEVERDELGRGPLAIALGRRLHRIWCRLNGIRVPGDDRFEAGGDERSAFVLHLDAPWGGGKTSFANFLARVLNPFPRGGAEAAKFLVERAGGAVGTIFVDDPPAGGGEGGTAAQWPEDARRPWIVVNFNAWQAEHCTPPWWTFYQAIRKGCFASVWAEGRSAARPAQASAPPRPLVEERIWSWAALWRRELMWRLRTPKVVARLATFVVAALALLILWQTNVIFRGDEGPDFNAGNALGFMLAGIGGISGLWGLGALFTESIAPGTDDAAERRSLGGGDPFERFRRHFARTMAAVRRPVMVIVDDLDRCRPDFVVDLVRGIQTLLRSPRVVFVILGDRDWIERAFEAHHAAMSKVNVGPEQDFGARFVEKAIQMSFILPEMAEPSQESYVRRVLIGPGGSAAAAASPAPPEIAQQLRADYREKVAAAPTPEARKQAEGELLEQYRGELEVAATAEGAAEAQAAPAEEIAKAAADTAEQQAIKMLSEERALLAAVDERMGQALLHRLEPLARFFPANPRQIKRIVNAITMYTAVGYLQMEMDESDPRGIELAIWVIIMTEWPKTWRVLASCPKLADLLAADRPEEELDKMAASELPGSRASTLRELDRIRADPDLFALIASADGRPRLRSESVAMFARLTPLYSRKQRLAEAGAAGGTDDDKPAAAKP